MPEGPTPVNYAPIGTCQGTTRSCLPFEETLARLKAAITAEELWLIHEINPQMLLERGGFAMLGARQLLFFHPRYVAKLLACDPGALLEAPLKIAVLELPDGSVMLRHSDVAAAFARYPGLEAMGSELDGCIQRILATVAP